MDVFFEVSGYLSILLSGLALAAQSVVMGGIAFLLLAACPLVPALGNAGAGIVLASRRLLAWSGLFLGLLGPARIALQLVILLGTTSVPLGQALMGGFVIAWALQASAGVVVFLLAWPNRRILSPGLLLIPAAAILAGTLATSHAAGRLDNATALFALTALHALGAAVWIGGLPFLLIGLSRLRCGHAIGLLGRRYSALSIAGVAAILGSGVTLGVFYIGSLESVYGTAYGLMTGVKAALLGMLLLLGAANFLTARGLRADPGLPTLRFRRFVEAEIGIGLTVFFAAASLTSVPPGIDLPDDRVTMTEIVQRVWPVSPRFESPDHASLALVALQDRLDAEAARTASIASRAFVPGTGVLPARNAQDVAWSEYNHNWAGLLVLGMGLLALAERAGWRPGRHWPLLLLAMAAFLFIRSDPEVWPLGPIGFFESLRDAEVVQHRAYVLVIVVFGVFEWLVRTGRLRRPGAGSVFPIMCAFGGALLLTHAHAISNVKEALLIEISHAGIGLFGVAAGWSRWVDLRVPGPAGRLASWFWPVCFVVIGLLLVGYRETSIVTQASAPLPHGIQGTVALPA
ncbi:copper resistance D family protein [Sphingomonas sp.]|uniref:copper resistance D family protein n=1 Tax=Sphingomonas sp. TaxID=28214 RepID=UPI0035B1C0FB